MNDRGSTMVRMRRRKHSMADSASQGLFGQSSWLSTTRFSRYFTNNVASAMQELNNSACKKYLAA